jgi:hypothetical protein
VKKTGICGQTVPEVEVCEPVNDFSSSSASACQDYHLLGKAVLENVICVLLLHLLGPWDMWMLGKVNNRQAGVCGKCHGFIYIVLRSTAKWGS